MSIFTACNGTTCMFGVWRTSSIENVSGRGSGEADAKGRQRQSVHAALVLDTRLRRHTYAVRQSSSMSVCSSSAPAAAFGDGLAVDEDTPCPLQLLERAMPGATGCERLARRPRFRPPFVVAVVLADPCTPCTPFTAPAPRASSSSCSPSSSAPTFPYTPPRTRSSARALRARRPSCRGTAYPRSRHSRSRATTACRD